MEPAVGFVPIEKILEHDLPMEEYVDGHKSKIGVTIITPNQMVHAIPINDKTKYHYHILKPSAKILYPEMTSDIKEFQLLTVHYIISPKDSEDINMAFIYSPAYITPNQSEMLKNLLQQLIDCGYKLGLIIGEYNPLTNREEKDIKKFFISHQLDEVPDVEEYILNIYRDNGRIVDYTLPFGEERILSQEEQYKM